MDIIKTVTVHGRKIDINVSTIFSGHDSNCNFAICLIDPKKTFSYRPYRTYPEACTAMRQHSQRLNHILMIDVDGTPLHYAHAVNSFIS